MAGTELMLRLSHQEDAVLRKMAAKQKASPEEVLRGFLRERQALVPGLLFSIALTSFASAVVLALGMWECYVGYSAFLSDPKVEHLHRSADRAYDFIIGAALWWVFGAGMVIYMSLRLRKQKRTATPHT